MDRWTVDPMSGRSRGGAPLATADGDLVMIDVVVAFVPEALGAHLLAVVAVDADGQPVAVAVEAGSAGVTVEAVVRTTPPDRSAMSASRAPAAGDWRSTRRCWKTRGIWPTR